MIVLFLLFSAGEKLIGAPVVVSPGCNNALLGDPMIQYLIIYYYIHPSSFKLLSSSLSRFVTCLSRA